MSAKMLLASLFEYKTWADENLIRGLLENESLAHDFKYQTATRIFEHAHIVDCLFQAHLQRKNHSYSRTESDEPPDPKVLFESIRNLDRWYVHYLANLDEADLSEAITFSFTDGTTGTMTREEMLGHLIAHGGYHRGEVGQILTQLTGSSPRDTFTGFLHEVEPQRSVGESPGKHRN
ncbi:DinB family protein [Paraburkholderia ferrariae]|uniref:DinB family protein n=1 Tax=Paraburkholderia ferrariae TaxID=386056 RepID=UPI0004834B05|nr:DinB family protein [Paraburkholderia ferrariae]